MPRYRQAMNRSARARLNAAHFHATFRPSRPLEGAFARHCVSRTGCGVLRVCPCKRTPGRRPATPPFRHYERNVRMHHCETEGHRSCAPSDGFAKAGSGPTIAEVERREASIPAGMQGASQAPAGLRHWPAVGCRCTRAPFGAPLPLGRGGKRRGENANLGGLMPRENDDACLEASVARIERS